MTNVTDEILGKIARQQNDLFRRVREGALDPSIVSAGLQLVIENKLPAPTWAPPKWWPGYEQQIARAHEKFGKAIWLPNPPANFVPRTKTEVPLLHVPSGFDSLWDKVDAPAGYIKYRTEVVKSGKRDLRLAPKVPNRTEAVWLAFDPEHGKGERPDKFWGQSNLAASEVLSAAIQFPEWVSAWFNSASAPNLSGYQLKYDTVWSRVPCLYRWYDDRRLELRGRWPDYGSGCWASPSVREC